MTDKSILILKRLTKEIKKMAAVADRRNHSVYGLEQNYNDHQAGGDYYYSVGYEDGEEDGAVDFARRLNDIIRRGDGS